MTQPSLEGRRSDVVSWPGGAEYALTMAGHRREFDRALEAVEAKVIELFAMVAEDLPGATEALLTGNNEMLRVLAEREQAIDALYREISTASSPARSGGQIEQRHQGEQQC